MYLYTYIHYKSYKNTTKIIQYKLLIFNVSNIFIICIWLFNIKKAEKGIHSSSAGIENYKRVSFVIGLKFDIR